MNLSVLRCIAASLATLITCGGHAAAQAPTFKEAPRYQPSEPELAEIRAGIDALAGDIRSIPEASARDDPRAAARLADVEVYLKAARWIVRHGEFYNKKYVDMTKDVLARGRDRAGRLKAGKSPWTDARGGTIRGYVSRVDGSVQPYAVIVPESYSRSGPARLDVVLHGRGATLNEVSFIAAHDGKPTPADASGLVLHVFGRTNNAYRWAGEADVFEAIDAVKRDFPVDDRRIVLRGFSMGGAGAWHLGLHHPSLWSSVEAGAGFTESRRYARLRDIPAYQEKGLHIYDAVDYALNAFDVPMVGYGGEEDPQLQASVNIKDALEALGVRMDSDGLVTRAEGIDFLHVVGAKMGHQVDRESARIMKAFHDERAARAADPLPKRIRFVTYTTKYNRAGWLTVERLQEHYRRAIIDAEIRGGEVHINQADNVAVLGVDVAAAGKVVHLGGREFSLPSPEPRSAQRAYFRRSGGEWSLLNAGQASDLLTNAEKAKRRDLQGPIDDAFMGPFLCVRGTGTPWNREVQAWADERLNRFGQTWSKWLRGDLPVKDDGDVTDDDIRDRHLVLFGDPGSNRLIAKVLADLPLKWTRQDIELGGPFSSADSIPALIAPNPLNPSRYVVLNSGHTFDDRAFAGTNALLYPRLGDYAVLGLDPSGGEVKLSGYFDEEWKLK